MLGLFVILNKNTNICNIKLALYQFCTLPFSKRFLAPQNDRQKCVAVLTMLYEKNGAVSCVGSDFISDWVLYLARTWLVLTQFVETKNSI